jgi:hypothetical protein
MTKQLVNKISLINWPNSMKLVDWRGGRRLQRDEAGRMEKEVHFSFGETPQWSTGDRGGSPPAPWNPSARNANQRSK